MLNIFKKTIFYSIVFCCLCFTHPCFAVNQADSSQVLSPPTLPVSDGGGCAYFAQDGYSGAELMNPGYSSLYYGPGAAWISASQIDSGAPTNLSWKSGATSPLVNSVNCDGTYQIIFSVQVQATTNGGPFKLLPCVKTTSGTTLYGTCPPTTSSPVFVTYDSNCNSGNYCGTRMYNFAVRVQLTKGQMVSPPSFISEARLVLVGGQFTVYYYGP